MGLPDWRCPWGQQGPANNLPDCWGSLSRCPAHRNGDWRRGRRPGPSSSEQSSWILWCRSVDYREKALCLALLSFQRCYSKKYWGRFYLPEMTPPTGYKQKAWLIRLLIVYILRWVCSVAEHSRPWEAVLSEFGESIPQHRKANVCMGMSKS